MAQEKLASDGVLAAVAEFDNRGRDDFLREYGFSKARSYFLVVDGNLYDSKAIVGRALGMSPAEFSGGDHTVKRWLEELNFEVRYIPVSLWTREELVLACAVLAANNWKAPGDDSWKVVQLSELLQVDMFHPADHHGPDFRSPQAVAWKQEEFVASHRHGGIGERHEDEVVRDFLARPAEMQTEASLLRARVLKLRPEQVKAPDVIKNRSPVPVVFVVPVEAHRTKTFTVSATAERKASRVEAALMKRYQELRASEGHGVTGMLIKLPGETSPLRIDLYDVDRAELIEAKGSAEREYVRLALGQVLDYARYVEHEHLAVLLPERPKTDLIDLLAGQGIRCIYEVTEGRFATA